MRNLGIPDFKSGSINPKIVSTPDTLSGTPRIDGHRIGVCHILANARKDIVAATKVNFPQLAEAEVNAAIDYAIEQSENAPPAQTPRWISVEERMPAERENGRRWVMVYDKAWDSIYFAVWLEDEWEPCEERETQPREITHWQPLPFAPEAEVE